MRSPAPATLKFKEPMFIDATSGWAHLAGASRWSSDMPRPPPVVMFRMALLRALISGRNCANSRGSWSGRPVSGSRACRCSIAAPASAAATASSAICFGVMGR
ncbi:hypothetical protein D3C72_1607540 [compost metagenome]